MKLLKLTKRENEYERCLCLWTPWLTVVWDFGSVQCRGTDEFELVIKYRAYGPVFYFGNRDIEKLGERKKFARFQFTKIQPRYAELRKKRIEDRDFYETKEQLVREGKRKNPANMSYAERHAATMEAVRKMKFTENFVHLMTTPVAKLALERGEEVRDDEDGRLLTVGEFEADKQKYARDFSLPGIAHGVLGFRKSKSGEGYEPIRVRAPKQGEIASAVEEHPMLESGQ